MNTLRYALTVLSVLLAGACSSFTDAEKAEIAATGTILAACQVEGRAAYATCHGYSSDAICNHEAIAAYEACKARSWGDGGSDAR